MRSKKTLLISFMLFFSLCFAVIPSIKADAAVKLNKKQITLYEGKSTTLKLKGTSKKAKWTSSNKKVATVSSKGKVKAKKKGTAKIIAKVGKKKYTCKVTVKAKKKAKQDTGNEQNTNKSFALESIALNTTTLQMESGEESILKVKYTPSNTTDDKTVKWSSSNVNCASVDSNGTVYALKEGSATIKAVVGTKTASCTVYVSKSGVLSNSSLTLEYPNTHKLSLGYATVTKWESSNTKIATVSNDGTVTAVSCGNVLITCYDTYNNSYTCNVKVTYPDITIAPETTAYRISNGSVYYYMKVLVENNSNYNIKFNNSAMMYFDSSNEYLILLDENLDIVSKSNEVSINPGSKKYVYGFEGKNSIRLTTTGMLGTYVEINGVEYIVFSDFKGTILDMSIPSK